MVERDKISRYSSESRIIKIGSAKPVSISPALRGKYLPKNYYFFRTT